MFLNRGRALAWLVEAVLQNPENLIAGRANLY